MSLISRISQNPYRILGCFSNSSIREIEKNKSRALAFARVKKTPTFPTDNSCTPITTRLPPPSRTPDDIENAAASLVLPRERLRHAFFWFASNEPSLRSTLCIFVADNDSVGFVRRALNFFHDSSKCKAFVASVAGAEFSISESECRQLFLEEVLAETNDSEFLEKLIHLCNAEGFQSDAQFLSRKILMPTLAEIDACIANAQKKATPEANLLAAKQLCTKARPLLNRLKKVIPTTNEVYIAAADKLARTILNLSISYYNDSDDDDSEDKALELVNSAESIAIGNTLRERIEKNKKTIEKQRIPPSRKMVFNILEPLTKKADNNGFVTLPELLRAIDKIKQISTLSQEDKNFAGRICFNLFAHRIVEERKRYTSVTFCDGISISIVAEELLSAFPVSAYTDEEIELLLNLGGGGAARTTTNGRKSTGSTFWDIAKGCLGYILFFFVIWLLDTCAK